MLQLYNKSFVLTGLIDYLLNLADNSTLIQAILVSFISFVIVVFMMPRTISSLISKGKVVKDFHKPELPAHT